jgi:hypothetical protein
VPSKATNKNRRRGQVEQSVRRRQTPASEQWQCKYLNGIRGHGNEPSQAVLWGLKRSKEVRRPHNDP